MIANVSSDVIVLQKHWLTPSNLNKFDDCFPNYFSFGSSAMSQMVETGVLRGRSFRGTMTMINNRLKIAMNVTYSERYGFLKIDDCVIAICQHVLTMLWYRR